MFVDEELVKIKTGWVYEYIVILLIHHLICFSCKKIHFV